MVNGKDLHNYEYFGIDGTKINISDLENPTKIEDSYITEIDAEIEDEYGSDYYIKAEDNAKVMDNEKLDD